MTYRHFENVRIAGISVAIPKHVEDNREAARELGVDDVERFIENVGVERRHTAVNGQTTSDLCYEAAERLLTHLNVSGEEINGIVLVTQTADYIQPATACVLHGRLGLPKSAVAFDVNLGCSGFVYGIGICAALLCGMGLRRVLLLAGDIWQKNPENSKKDDLLFGDAGTAVLVENGGGSIETALYSDGTGYTHLIIPGGKCRRPYREGENYWKLTKPVMDGESVFVFSITEVPRAVKTFFKQNGKTLEDYDYCVLHQANRQMISYIAKKLRIPSEKLPLSMDRYGNTSSASIPLGIADLCQRDVQKERLSLLTSGFGIGLSWGVAAFEIETKNVLPIYETDAVFKEAYRGDF